MEGEKGEEETFLGRKFLHQLDLLSCIYLTTDSDEKYLAVTLIVFHFVKKIVWEIENGTNIEKTTI